MVETDTTQSKDPEPEPVQEGEEAGEADDDAGEEAGDAGESEAAE